MSSDLKPLPSLEPGHSFCQESVTTKEVKTDTFQAAKDYVESRGYSPEAAEKIVEREGADNILAGAAEAENAGNTTEPVPEGVPEEPGPTDPEASPTGEETTTKEAGDDAAPETQG